MLGWNGCAAVMLSVAMTVTGCASSGVFVWLSALPPQARDLQPYRIHRGDLVSVEVWNQPKLSGDVRVRPDGRSTLPLLGDIAMEGLTAEGCAEQIAARLDGTVVDPKVTVTLKELKKPTVSVIGEVQRAASYPLVGDESILQLLARAGGLNEFARRDHIYVLRRRPKMLRIRVTYDQLTRAEGDSLFFPLQDGDVIVVE